MPRTGEVWYFERSVAARLARSLSRRYTLRALSRPSRSHRMVMPRSVESGIVCIVDPVRDDLAALRRLARRQPRMRLIGVSVNGVDAGHAAGCFATLPRKAGSAMVLRTVAAAFANID